LIDLLFFIERWIFSVSFESGEKDWMTHSGIEHSFAATDSQFADGFDLRRLGWIFPDSSIRDVGADEN
jgi:hypothetical protein